MSDETPPVRSFAPRALDSAPLDRRSMLAVMGSMVAGAWLAGCSAPTSTATASTTLQTPAPSRSYLRTITLAQWSVHRAMRDGSMTTLRFPVAARADYGIGTVEYVSTLFGGDPMNDAYLGQLLQVCRGEGVRSGLIMIDAEGDLGAPEAAERAEAVRRHARWLHAAAALGCARIRVNARSTGAAADQLAWCAEGIGALADIARPMQLEVIVENHGGISSDGAWMARLMRTMARENVGTLPDFGNFRLSATEQYDRYLGTEQMLPWARDVSAKSYAFDAQGNETTIDYARMFALLDAAHYAGPIGIEYEGKGLSEPEGIRATKRLIERYGATA